LAVNGTLYRWLVAGYHEPLPSSRLRPRYDGTTGVPAPVQQLRVLRKLVQEEFR